MKINLITPFIGVEIEIDGERYYRYDNNNWRNSYHDEIYDSINLEKSYQDYLKEHGDDITVICNNLYDEISSHFTNSDK